MSVYFNNPDNPAAIAARCSSRISNLITFLTRADYCIVTMKKDMLEVSDKLAKLSYDLNQMEEKAND